MNKAIIFPFIFNIKLTSKKNLFFSINQLNQKDPTSSIVLRNQFTKEMSRRFRELKKVIRTSIVDNDVFGLKVDANPFPLQVFQLQPLGFRQFQFRRDAEKVDGFMLWLREQESKGVLEVKIIPGSGRGDSKPWTNLHIQSAYQKGMQKSRSELKKLGVDLPTFTGEEGKRALDIAFSQPFHANRVGLIYTRVFNELKGVTETMNGQISRELALGIAEGRGPAEIARNINNRVDNIGITRAKLIARTEVIQTLNEAALNEFDAAESIIEEEIFVEWQTAEDERVRATHAERNGRIFKKEVAQVLIGEPNCRCALLPYIESVQGEPEKKIIKTKSKVPRKQLIPPSKKT